MEISLTINGTDSENTVDGDDDGYAPSANDDSSEIDPNVSKDEKVKKVEVYARPEKINYHIGETNITRPCEEG